MGGDGRFKFGQRDIAEWVEKYKIKGVKHRHTARGTCATKDASTFVTMLRRDRFRLGNERVVARCTCLHSKSKNHTQQYKLSHVKEEESGYYKISREIKWYRSKDQPSRDVQGEEQLDADLVSVRDQRRQRDPRQIEQV